LDYKIWEVVGMILVNGKIYVEKGKKIVNINNEQDYFEY
jgi:hypothetical protein